MKSMTKLVIGLLRASVAVAGSACAIVPFVRPRRVRPGTRHRSARIWLWLGWASPALGMVTMRYDRYGRKRRPARPISGRGK